MSGPRLESSVWQMRSNGVGEKRPLCRRTMAMTEQEPREAPDGCGRRSRVVHGLRVNAVRLTASATRRAAEVRGDHTRGLSGGDPEASHC